MAEILTESDELEALQTRVSERTKAFRERGFWARAWDLISGQRYTRGLVVFEENQSDILQIVVSMVSKVRTSTGVDLGQQGVER